MSFLSNNLGGLLDFAGGLIGIREGEEEAGKVRAYERENYQNRYQWQVQDLMKAGLNPMLAYTQGAPNVGGGGAMSQGHAQAFKGIAQASSAWSLMKSQKEVLEAERDLKKAETAKVKGDTIPTNVPGYPQGITAAHKISEININTLKKWEINEQINLLAKEVESKTLFNDIQRMEVDKMRAILPALVTMAFNEAQHGSLSLATAQNVADFERSELGKSIRYIQAVTGTAGDIIGQVGTGVAAATAAKILKKGPGKRWETRETRRTPTGTITETYGETR